MCMTSETDSYTSCSNIRSQAKTRRVRGFPFVERNDNINKFTDKQNYEFNNENMLATKL